MEKTIFNKDVISESDIKEFMRLLVKQSKKYPIIYKYLTYDSGCQMLRYNNIQFTRGDVLNDKEDLSISKFNTDAPYLLCNEFGISSDLVTLKIKEQSEVLSSFGVCSLGTSPFNRVLWKRYASDEYGKENGICIGINQAYVINALFKQNIKTACVLVRYKSSTLNSIPWFAISGPLPVKIFTGYQFFALKNSDPWEEEKEIRLVYTQTMKEQYRRIVLPKNCFFNVYMGKDMTLSQKQKVGQILNRNLPKVKRIPL